MGTIGALIGLALAIFLIIKKIPPAYSMIAGALIGGLVGGLAMTETVSVMIDGVKGVVPAIVRILAAGVLSGVLIESGAANTISNAIIRGLGERFALAGIALTTMLLCGVGVFVDVAVITVAPIALAVGRRLNVGIPLLLLMMIGGGKCGNIISPNPNTIIAAENFGADLSLTMLYNVVPAIIGLLFVAFVLPRIVPKKFRQVATTDFVESKHSESEKAENLPSVWSSLTAPVVTIALLALRPIFDISIDPLVALPVGGLVGLIAMRRTNITLKSIEHGLKSMTGVAVLLIGTGTIAGIINHCGLDTLIIAGLDKMDFSPIFIAPIAGMLMSAATASTTAGATVASASFCDEVIAAGVSPAWGAAMTNAGATILDHLPHGSFFHATGGVCGLSFRRRLALIPFESLVGLVLAAMSTLACYFFA